MTEHNITRRTALAALGSLPFAGGVVAQDALKAKRIRFNGRKIEYLIRYARGGGEHPMLLCFGGGDANRGIVEYYDQVYTPESVYADHHVVMPIGPDRQLFFQFSNRDARAMIEKITKAEKVEGPGLISGVSNGGRAAFRFAQAAPESFRGLVVMPGAMGRTAVPILWKDYAIVLAYGTRDPQWKTETDRAYYALRGRVGAVERVALAGQGHVVGADYDIDPVYARLKELEAELGR